MAYIEPLDEQLTDEHRQYFSMIEQAMGFVPNSMKTMARWPELLQAFAGLAGVIAGASLDPQLRTLVSLMASSVTGCRYCQAHTAHASNHVGVSTERIQAVFNYEDNPLFSEAERAALRFAHHSASQPNTVSQDDIDQLKQHFTEREIVELNAVVSLFAWLNRWNDSMATTLEGPPRQFAEQHLSPFGWSVEKHA